MLNEIRQEDIAIIGMSGQFPNSKNLEEFWNNLCDTRDLITRFSLEEIQDTMGFDRNIILNDDYVRAKGCISNEYSFDNLLFNCTPAEAQYMDPQQRKLLECTWNALENANLDSSRYAGNISSFYCSSINTYFIYNICPKILSTKGRLTDENLIIIGNEKDFLATKIAFKLGFTGPSKTIQTACSSSLVCVTDACQSLLNFDADVAIAGSASITFPVKSGYFCTKHDINSTSGVCRPFDVDSDGTVPGNGVAVVILKRLEDAVRDRDNIICTIRGFAVNNDGAQKIGYTAPSQNGQKKCIVKAIENSEITANDLSYIESHGTGTLLGDPIEFNALNESFSEYTADKKFCALGTLKANIGHLDVCSGIAGLIKVALSLKNSKFPGNCHFKNPNPELNIANSPFYMSKTTVDFNDGKKDIFAGVSSFGIGGTNAHVIVQNYNVDKLLKTQALDYYLFVFSAATISALKQNFNEYSDFFSKENLNCDCVSYTLQIGRKNLRYRAFIISKNLTELKNKIDQGEYSITDSNDKEFLNTDFTVKLNAINSLPNISSTFDNLNVLGKAWSFGLTIIWKKLYLIYPDLVSLPLYQFDRTEYCFDYTKNSENTIKSTTLEDFLLKAIRKSLQLSNISVNDNYIEIGGDSLLALDILQQIKTELYVEMPIQVFYEAKQLKDIAETLNNKFLFEMNTFSDEQRHNIKSYLIQFEA